ncbi:MAG TPA: hypothetical protein VH309_11235, partial [Elusimicrobiota bacterium]|nr:hypothetical protein [Elusimicrobiota bacterium]
MGREPRRLISGSVAHVLALLSPGAPAYAQVARVFSGEASSALPRAVLPAATVSPLLAPSLLAAPTGTPGLSLSFAAPSAAAAPALAPAAAAAADVPIPAAASGKLDGAAEPQPLDAPAGPAAAKTLSSVAALSAKLAAKPAAPAQDRAEAGRLFDEAEGSPEDPDAAEAVAAAAPAPAVERSRNPFRRAGALAASLKKMSLGDPSIQEFTRPYKRKLLAARLMRMTDAPIALLLGWGTGQLIDLANKGHSMPGTLVPFVAAAAILTATTVAELVSDLKYNLLVNFMQYDVIEAFRVDVFKRIFASSRAVFGKQDAGAVANRLSDDAADVVNLGVTTPISTPYHLLAIASSMGMLLWTNIHAALSASARSPLALPLWLGMVGVLGAVMVAYGLIASRSAAKFESLEEEYQTRRSDMVAHAQRSFGDRAVYLGLGI